MSAIQLRNKGNLTLPAEIRRKYQLNEGTVFDLIDLEDGSFLLTPRASQVVAHGDRVAKLMAQQRVSIEEILKTLDEERQTFYRERYANR